MANTRHLTPRAPRHPARLRLAVPALLACLTLLLPAQADEAGAGPDLHFVVGEQLTYDLYWGVFHVGSSVVTTEWTEEEGRKLLYVGARTRSNKVIATLYPVDDVVEALIEPVAFRPVRFTRNLREGRTRRHDAITFDFDTLTARYESFLSSKVKELQIRDDSRDLLTFMYFMRRHGFQVGSTNAFKVMADEKLYDLTVAGLKLEDVKLDAYGPVPSIKLEPKAMFEGLFVRKGRMFTWVSTDERRLLTKAWVDTPFANVKILLRDVKGPGSDSWVRTQPP